MMKMIINQTNLHLKLEIKEEKSNIKNSLIEKQGQVSILQQMKSMQEKYADFME